MFIFIKILSIFICTIYVYKTISHNLTTSHTQKIYYIYITLSLALLSYILNSTFKEFTYFIPILILWCIISALSSQPQKAFIVTMLSFTISFCSHALASFLSTVILYVTITDLHTFPYHFLAIGSSFLHIVGIIFLCKIKRFRKGIPFLSTNSSINIATLICVILLLLFTFVAENYAPFTTRLFIISMSTLVLAFLIYWWQAQITKSYRRSLELRELESLRTEVAELNLKIEKLMNENEKLARITHRDNTLITTLKNSTVKYLATDFKNPAEALATRDKLISNINALSAGRTSLPVDYQQKTAREFDTSIALLDELLHHADEEAIQKQIAFSVHFGTDLANFVPKDISESDLVHTIDDLLKNAFKSTLTREKRIVQLQFYKLGKHFVIEVADNGIPFEVKSLVNMGLEKLTTYPDGSGIGLVDIWNTKESCGATYHIEEYATATPFSKKISLTFDKKNRYSIRTWRKQEILQMSKRVDLQVYEHNE